MSNSCPNDNCVDDNQSPVSIETHDFNANMVMIIILICLMTIFFIVWFIYGPQLFEKHSDHERANVIVPIELQQGTKNV